MNLKEILGFIIGTVVALLLVFKVKPKQGNNVLPHPKEPVDYTRNMDNTSIHGIIVKWFIDWNVTDTNYWIDEVDIKLDVSMQYPAWSSAESRVIGIRPEHCTPGVIAHEAAHVSYGLLNIEEKMQFSSLYFSLKNSGIVAEVLKQHPYAKSNDVEAHADIYRYASMSMPDVLKRFYPKLIKEDL